MAAKRVRNSESQKRGRGRPPTVEGGSLTAPLTTKVRPEEAAAVQALADAVGMTKNELLRVHIRDLLYSKGDKHCPGCVCPEEQLAEEV